MTFWKNFVFGWKIESFLKTRKFWLKKVLVIPELVKSGQMVAFWKANKFRRLWKMSKLQENVDFWWKKLGFCLKNWKFLKNREISTWQNSCASWNCWIRMNRSFLKGLQAQASKKNVKITRKCRHLVQKSKISSKKLKVCDENGNFDLKKSLGSLHGFNLDVHWLVWKPKS